MAKAPDERLNMTSRSVLALGAVGYVALVLLSSHHPGARAWSLHLLGFLPLPSRAAVLSLLVAGVVAVALGAFLPSKTTVAASDPSRAAKGGRPKRSGANAAWLLLVPFGLTLWLLRTRTHFMGDGVVWLSGLVAGSERAESEPMAKALWLGVADILRACGAPVIDATVGVFPVILGVLAAPILWGIAGEIVRGASARVIAFALLLTLGATQLFFGYIESYPPTAVAILAYLWLGLRYVRGRGSPVLVGSALAVAIACHLSALYLVPSYVFAIGRERTPLARRAALILLAPAGAALLLLALGSKPGDWYQAVGIAAHAARGGGGAGRLGKPYPALSLDHALDLANAILLVLPVPALLIAARLAAKPPAVRAPDGGVAFISVAAAGGLFLAGLFVLPVPPAQDWDLTSLLLLPAAVLGVRAGRRFIEAGGERRLHAGLVALGLAALLSFVLVNADADSGIRRFRTLIGPDARITSFGRAYGFGILAEHYEDREDNASALVYARQALAAEPTNPRYWLKVGTALYKLDRYEEAIPFLEESLRRGPDSGAAKHNLGLCYMRKGRFTEALPLFREAVALDPDRPDWRHNLGVAFINLGEPDSAYATWRSLLARWPGYPKTVRSMTMHFGPGAASGAPSGTLP